MAKSTKNSETTKQVETEQPVQQRPEFVVYTPDESVTTAALSDLIALDSTPIENAELAMRQVNPQHVSHMVESLKAGNSLPALTVVDTSWGTLTLDGLHRWAAYEKYLREVLEENAGEDDSSKKLAKETLQAARQSYFVPIKQIAVSTPFEMLDTSFKANLDHGLPANNESRSRYALWLMAESKHRGDNPVLSMRKAAEKAKVSHAAVSQLASRMRAKNQKMIDVEFVGEDENEIADKESQEASSVEAKEYAKAEKHLNNILKAVKYFAHTEMTSTETARFVGSFATGTTKEAIDEVYSLLSYIRDAAPYAPSPEQTELIQTNVQEPEVFHVG